MLAHHGLVQQSITYLRGFWRKELKGECWFALGLRLGNFLGDVHGGDLGRESSKER